MHRRKWNWRWKKSTNILSDYLCGTYTVDMAFWYNWCGIVKYTSLAMKIEMQHLVWLFKTILKFLICYIVIILIHKGNCPPLLISCLNKYIWNLHLQVVNLISGVIFTWVIVFLILLFYLLSYCYNLCSSYALVSAA